MKTSDCMAPGDLQKKIAALIWRGEAPRDDILLLKEESWKEQCGLHFPHEKGCGCECCRGECRCEDDAYMEI